MWIEVFENTEGYTQDAIFNEFLASSTYENIYELDFTNARLTCFEYAVGDDSDRICAVTPTQDGAFICFIYFSPDSLLAQQILSTISFLSDKTGDAVIW